MQDDEDGKFSLLKDLFAECPDAMISIDMKERDDILIAKVNDLIKDFKREDKTVWGSMFKEQHQAAQAINANISSFYSGSQAVKTYIWWILGCLFCCPLPADVLMTTQMTSTQSDRVKNMFAERNNGRTSCRVSCGLKLARFIHWSSKGLLRHI